MLQRGRRGDGLSAELTGMFAPSVGNGLHQLAEDYNADLIVVGSSSRGLIGRVLVGDDARGTVSGAAVRSRSRPTTTPIGAATSGLSACLRRHPRGGARARACPQLAVRALLTAFCRPRPPVSPAASGAGAGGPMSQGSSGGG